jgi:predicted RNA-binding Zn ribbon-like protein
MKAASEFVFLGGHPALDFVNTRTVDRGVPVERLTDFEALLRWARQARIPAADDAEGAWARWSGHPDGPALLAEAVALREQGRAWLGGESRSGLLGTVNRLLATDAGADRVVPEGGWFVRRRYLGDAGPSTLLAGLAGAAADLICIARERTPRRCVCDDCEAWFLAYGRTAGRVFCSSERCGTRVRSARYEKVRPHRYR